MPFGIPNKSNDGGATSIAFPILAEPDASDWDALNRSLSGAAGAFVISGCVVTAPNGNLTVAVSAGVVFAAGGPLVVGSNAALAITAADPVNDRFTSVYVNSVGVLSTVDGTAVAPVGGQPVASTPATPAGGVLLAVVYVPHTATSLSSNNLQDKRFIIGVIGGPSSAVDGNMTVFDGTSGRLVKDGGVTPAAFANNTLYKQLVQWATQAQLPQAVYANGSSGVGATLTASANGALAVDGNSPAVNDRVLVKDQEIHGTAVSATASTIKLMTRAPATDNVLNGMLVKITSGTGVGQTRTISGYVGATNVATVSVNWGVTPDSTSIYTIGGEQNGVYVVTQVGDGSHPFILTRAPVSTALGSGFDSASLLAGGLIYVQNGSGYNANTAWEVQTAGPWTVGTTPIMLTQVSQPLVWAWALQLTPQSLSDAAWTGVTWDTIVFDNGGFFTAASANMHIPIGRMFDWRADLCVGQVKFGVVQGRIVQDGTPITHTSAPALNMNPAGTEGEQHLPPLCAMPGGTQNVAGATIQAQLFQDSGASINTAGICQMMIFQMMPLGV